MEWGKLKTVLIWLFLAVNIFLGVTLQQQQQRKYSIPSDLLDDVISVLASKNVVVEKYIIPQKRVSLRGFLFLTAEEEKSKAAERIGQNFTKGEEENTYTDGENFLSFSGQSQVSFTGNWKYYRYRYSAKGANEAAEAFLKQLCDNTLVFIQKKAELDPANQIYKITYGQVLDKIEILDSEISVWADKSGIIKAEGTVIYTPCYSYEKGQLCDSFNSLLQYSLLEQVQSAGGSTISAVRPVYTIGRKDTASVLIPGWEVTAPGQEKVCFNAISGERIK